MKVVYLHGVGDGDPEGSWLEGLNHGLASIDSPPIAESQTVAPRYSSFLGMEGIKSKHPERTYNVKDDHQERRAFERRQAWIHRSLGESGVVQTFGLGRVPGPVVEPLQRAAIFSAFSDVLKQVKRYMTDEHVRGAILSKILDELPTSGDILLIGHSLGSVVAIDLLDNLHPGLHVKRFVTIGSPAGSPALHEGSERILKRFPYARVDDWSNFLSFFDPVTAGRGLTGIFNGAQDFAIPHAAKHSSRLYLRNSAVARLISDAVYPPEPRLSSGGGVVLRLDDAQASALLALSYGHRVASLIDDDDRERYEDALAVLQDKLKQELTARSDGGPLPPEVMDLTKGKVPKLPHRWDLPDAIAQSVILAFANVLYPFEIAIGTARIDALIELLMDLGYPHKIGKNVSDAVRKVDETLMTRRIFGTKAKIAAAAAGVALIAAGPIGLAAVGAAAAAGGLAALGPGGIGGGPAMYGGLASTGAMVATVAATSRGGAQPPLSDPTTMAIQVAIAYALKSVGEPYDESLWHRLTASEAELGAELNRLTPFSDDNAPGVQTLKTALGTIKKLMDLMLESKLTPLAPETADIKD